MLYINHGSPQLENPLFFYFSFPAIHTLDYHAIDTQTPAMSAPFKQKTVVVGGGPVGALAALYAAQRGHEVELYELRSGMFISWISLFVSRYL